MSRLVTKMATTTNKVPVSPIQPQRQECSVKFKSPGLVEKDKEKMGEGCDYALPHMGQGISHGSADETTCPTELLYDGHGKCRHGTAKVLNVARGKVSEVAHYVEDLFKNHKEMVRCKSLKIKFENFMRKRMRPHQRKSMKPRNPSKMHTRMKKENRRESS